ncbi:MAG TPA: hypothetical protein VJS69_14090 [Candidatus Krumholzibacteria bacterium]|nr:hypothetical protein [Candidatus Krumholzibacteria bacterium]
MNRVIRSALIAAGLVAAALPALATQIIQVSPQEIAKASTLVVDGKVSGVRSYWNDDHSKIFTETTVAVNATHKGANASTVRVMTLGGVVGNVRQTVHGALAWSRGEEVLLFLEPAGTTQPGAFQVTGFSQGKYDIERDAKTGRKYVRQAMPGGVSGDTPSATSGTTSSQSDKVALDQFLGQVLGKK